MDSTAGPLRKYLESFLGAVRSKDGKALAMLISLEPYYTEKRASVPIPTEHVLRQRGISFQDIFSPLIHTNESGYYEVIVEHLNAAAIVGNKGASYIDAYTHQSQCLLAYLRDVYSGETRWCLPFFFQLIHDLRILAQRADAVLSSQGRKADKLEDAVRVLNKCFSPTFSDKNDLLNSKRWGVLQVVNSLFRAYFKLNTVRLCKNLIKSLSTLWQVMDIEKFQRDQVVTYKFFIGRIAILEGEFDKAVENLDYAFLHCPISRPLPSRPSSSSAMVKSKRNKQLILMYLIPINVMFGTLPTTALLMKYNLPQFDKLLKAVKMGDLRSFNEAVAEQEDFFIQKGLYLTIEQLKMVVYRNLFKRVVTAMESNKIPFSAFIVAFKWLGVEVDNDEMECILANLIYDGYIKGYIGHGAKAVVLKKDSPFPPLKEIGFKKN
eukprot:TRINITY_DN6178_c0_g1_i1.p1 TRINITY_DN6178_c0_g1~~TRINITY_DN6178_c0_g1_i1.p1  ORF type:complete len:435 (-),score=69.18 TRINITY_DN6178_c0_g1_i1:181-1485(-)